MPARLLIVDDDEDLRALLAEVLESEGYAVEAAPGGAAALAAVAAAPPDLVLLDLRMEDMDGAEVIARLRADQRTSAVPLVVMSGARDGAVPASVPHLLKPVGLDQLLSTVRSALGGA